MAERPAFKDRPKELREAAGLTQYRLAHLSGVKKQTLSDLEEGVNLPSWETVQRIAKAIGVSVEAFVIEGGYEVPAASDPSAEASEPEEAVEPQNRPSKRE